MIFKYLDNRGLDLMLLLKLYYSAVISSRLNRTGNAIWKIQLSFAFVTATQAETPLFSFPKGPRSFLASRRSRFRRKVIVQQKKYNIILSNFRSIQTVRVRPGKSLSVGKFPRYLNAKLLSYFLFGFCRLLCFGENKKHTSTEFSRFSLRPPWQ